MLTDLVYCAELLTILRVSRSTLYRLMKTRGFPRPFKAVSMREGAWWRADVEAWVKAQLPTEPKSA